MTTRKIYDCTEWHGGECPVPPDTLVVVRLRSGRQRKPVAAGAYDWQHRDDDCDIVEYRAITEVPDLEGDQMKHKKIYGPWIKWYGECPVPLETKVGLRFRSGATETGHRADDYSWRHGLNDPDDIVEYRVAIEQADLEAAENLLRDNGYIVTPPTKPLTFEDVTPMTEAPPEGTVYWAVQSFNGRGVDALSWRGDSFDLAVLRHRMAYLDKEDALIAARHIFGLKGGEL